MSAVGRVIKKVIETLFELAVAPVLVVLAVLSRVAPRGFDVGIGPEPMVTHKALKRAFETQGFRAQTFVSHTYFITSDFDVNYEKLPVMLADVLLFLRAIVTYRCLYIRFNGGPLMRTRLLRRVEPLLLKLAGVRTIVCGYGGDVQDQLLGKNLNYKHALVTDYPEFRFLHRHIERRMRMWSRHATYVIGGCDWVDYMFHWDAIMMADWCIDVRALTPSPPRDPSGPLRVLHAPNHTTIKGSDHLKRAIEKLKAEGHAIELVFVQKVPNTKIHELIREVDLVADQFVIGMYGFFAVEAMALGKPVMAYLEPRYVDLFCFAGLIEKPDDIPVIDTPWRDIEERLRWACTHRDALAQRAALGHAFALKHHSVEARGEQLARAMAKMGIPPRAAA